MSPSLLSTPASFEQDRFLTGSWRGVRRDASSHNLSLGADRLVARKCIQRVLSLHLPYFEVALPTLQLVVRDCMFISTTTPNSRWKETHVSPCDVCSFQCVCICVYLERERESEGVPIHCFGEFKVILLCFANWRSTSSSNQSGA